jgi:hypothetical protein
VPRISGDGSRPTSIEGGGTLEKAQAMAALESPRATKLYDRRGE